MAEIQPEEFELHSGRIGRATALTVNGVETMMIQNEERWSSDAFMICARANMEDSQCLSEGWRRHRW